MILCQLNSPLKANVSELGYREGHTPEQELLTKYLLSRLLNNGEDSSETGEDLLFEQLHCLYQSVTICFKQVKLLI